MAWFRKRPDPISERAKALSSEIAQLETRIKELDAQLQRRDAPSRPASSSHDQPSTDGGSSSARAGDKTEPIFEDVGKHRLKGAADIENTPEHYNELGVRKYDLSALLRRIRNHFRGPSTTNPKLVTYLSAGGVHGFEPLRYEKRVARNRFIVFVVLLFLALLGIFLVFRHR